MIHHLEGAIVERGDRYLVIEVEGIGYKVHTSRATQEAYANRTDPVKLYTCLHLGESDLTLYGFGTPEERELFELLLTVSGVGPKLAIGILSSATPERLQEAILSGSAESFAGIKGIGTKTADRLILELKEEIARLPLGGRPAPAYTYGRQEETALRALTRSLGFGEREARQAIAQAKESDGELSTEELIKRSLTFLSRS